MNKFDFNQTGGFPIETDTFQNLVKAFSLFNGLGEMAGNKAIIKGCEKSGSNIGDGVVYIDGEVYEFRGGLQQETVKIYENETEKEFENGDTKPVFFERYVGFGSGNGSILWADFTRIDPIREIQKATVPVGLISMWSGAIDAIPKGWALCDGNDTPDLSGKFIVGYDPDDADYDTIGNKGGKKEVTLSKDQTPDHSHGGSIYINGHKHDLPNVVYSNETGGISAGDKLSHDGNIYAREVRETSYSDGYSKNFTTDSVGGGKAHENRPPFYTLAYIIFKG